MTVCASAGMTRSRRPPAGALRTWRAARGAAAFRPPPPPPRGRRPGRTWRRRRAAAPGAASVRADPYAVVGAGLGAMSGALRGGASLGAEVMLESARAPADAPRVVGELLRRGERIPGLGHFVYQTGDPRSVLLLDLIRAAAPESGRLAVAEAVLAEARRRALPAPNIEFALPVLSPLARLIPPPRHPAFAPAP